MIPHSSPDHMPEVKSLHRYASFCANHTKLRLSCVLVLIRASSQATRKKKNSPHSKFFVRIFGQTAGAGGFSHNIRQYVWRECKSYK